MAKITLKKNPIQTNGELPQKGEKAPDFTLVDQELNDKSFKDFKGKKVLLSINPSLDTSVCASTAKAFNEFAAKHPNLSILIISKDLPFAQKRFCEGHGLKNVITLSMMRDDSFAKDYGVHIQNGPLQGVAARSVVLIDEHQKVLYSELVPEITQEPNYSAIEQELG